MKACVDVYYDHQQATAACILFKNWTDSIPSDHYQAIVQRVAPYVSGQFYRRELPCILKVLPIDVKYIDAILIDGYVWLENNNSPGLGALLYAKLDRSTPVIGIAKSRYKKSQLADEVIRGNSTRPLYITAIGIDQRVAARKIVKMHGKYRVPTLLKKVDQLTKISKYQKTF